MRRIRLSVVMTHPVQYIAPWLRYLAAQARDLELDAIYATVPTATQQGTEFGRSFQWDMPLTEGYRHRVVRPPRPGDALGSDHFFGLDVPEITAALDDSRPDVVLLFGWHSATQLRALAHCRRRGVPLLYRGDTNLRSAPEGWRRPIWRVRTRVLLRAFTGCLAVGVRAREMLGALGVPADRVFDSPHAVDNDFFAERARPHLTVEGRAAARAAFSVEPGERAVLFVGKLAANKRLGDVLAAVASLPRTRLLVAGDGPDRAELEASARRLGVPSSWLGFLNQTELPRAYAAADCLVLPSQRETWGLVVNEALATGLPCIVSDGVGCAPDLIVEGETGAVFAAADVGALRRALERAPARNGACGERVARHSFARATDGLVAACRRAMMI